MSTINVTRVDPYGGASQPPSGVDDNVTRVNPYGGVLPTAAAAATLTRKEGGRHEKKIRPHRTIFLVKLFHDQAINYQIYN